MPSQACKVRVSVLRQCSGYRPALRSEGLSVFVSMTTVAAAAKTDEFPEVVVDQIMGHAGDTLNSCVVTRIRDGSADSSHSDPLPCSAIED